MQRSCPIVSQPGECPSRKQLSTGNGLENSNHRTGAPAYNRSFARSGHMARNKLHWDANVKTKESRAGLVRVPLEVLLRNLRLSVIYSVPCDRIVQRAY